MLGKGHGGLEKPNKMEKWWKCKAKRRGGSYQVLTILDLTGGKYDSVKEEQGKTTAMLEIEYTI